MKLSVLERSNLCQQQNKEYNQSLAKVQEKDDMRRKEDQSMQMIQGNLRTNTTCIEIEKQMLNPVIAKKTYPQHLMNVKHVAKQVV